MRRKASTLESLRDRLRQAGLRSTGARLAVLRVLERASSPMSHAEVHEQVVEDGFDRATIYRNLMDLTDAGMLARGTGSRPSSWARSSSVRQ